MEVSEIKVEVEHSGDFKVKLEDNVSSVVYKVEVTPKVDIKFKEEDPPQGPSTSVTNNKTQSVVDNTVNTEQDPTSDVLNLEPELQNTSSGESEIESGVDSDQEHPQEISQSSQARSIKSNRNISKRSKKCAKIQKRPLLQCPVCPESFPRAGLLVTHVQNKHATVKSPKSDLTSDDEHQSLSQCPLCSKSLKSVQSLQYHFLKFHIKNKPFHCSICLEKTNEIKKFPTKSVLNMHIKNVHHPERFKFQCQVCSRKFQSRVPYKIHRKIHVEKKYKCEYCSKAYRKTEGMLKHIIEVHKEYTDRHETFKCDECEQLFCSQKDLDFHVLETHVEDTIECKICLRKFRDEKELSRHLDISHWESRTWLVCDVCSKVFKNNQKLVEHLEVQHKRFFKCRKCFRSFFSEEDYDGHSTAILDKKGRNVEMSQLQCKICLVFLKTDCDFSTHKDTHLGPSEIVRKITSQLDPTDPHGRFFKCDFCPKTFVQKSLLVDHATNCHPDEKKWECKSCEKSFQLKYQLIQHEELHSENKPYKCQLCPNSFTSMSNLTKHEETHKKDKRYKCSQCEKSFAVSLGLRVHVANYHGGERKFKCPICKKAFLIKSLLEEHSLVHTDERPFGCSKCYYSSKSAKQLRGHERRMHSENPSNKNKKVTVPLGPHSKYFENVVYICCLEECKFVTKDEKEVAIHNAIHGLPLVKFSRELPCPLYKNLNSLTSTSEEKIKKRTIQPRYKCKHCDQTYAMPSGLRKHVRTFDCVAKEKKVGRYPVHLGPRSKLFENLVFVCCVENCDFETKDEEEVAIHYTKHKLPKVILPRLLHGPSSAIFLSKSTSSSEHTIQSRYKCTQCFKIFIWGTSLRKHTKKFHNGKTTKGKKRIYNVSSSDEDEM